MPDPSRTLYVTCPAYAAESPRRRAEALRRADAFARSAGLTAVASPLLDIHPGVNRWLDPELRLQDLRTALRHPFIWAFRGGYGSVHLLPGLARLARNRRRGPVLIGYSDLTCLHAAWWTRGWPSWYGTLPEPGEADSWRIGSLDRLRSGRELAWTERSVASGRVLRPGAARGRLFAGCLSVLQALAGTRFQPDLRGTVLALEDVDEKPYRWDRALVQMDGAGMLKGVRALLVGSAGGEEHPDYAGPDAADIVADWADRLRIPALAGLPFGHGEDAAVLPLGAETSLVADGKGPAWSLSVTP